MDRLIENQRVGLVVPGYIPGKGNLLVPFSDRGCKVAVVDRNISADPYQVFEVSKIKPYEKAQIAFGRPLLTPRMVILYEEDYLGCPEITDVYSEGRTGSFRGQGVPPPLGVTTLVEAVTVAYQGQEWQLNLPIKVPPKSLARGIILVREGQTSQAWDWMTAERCRLLLRETLTTAPEFLYPFNDLVDPEWGIFAAQLDTLGWTQQQEWVIQHPEIKPYLLRSGHVNYEGRFDPLLPLLMELTRNYPVHEWPLGQRWEMLAHIMRLNEVELHAAAVYPTLPE